MFRQKFHSTVLRWQVPALAWPQRSRTQLTRQNSHLPVKGFTCPTCAVGLDTMLGRQKGVIHSISSYPDAMTVIEFHPQLSEGRIAQSVYCGVGLFRRGRFPP